MKGKATTQQTTAQVSYRKFPSEIVVKEVAEGRRVRTNTLVSAKFSACAYGYPSEVLSEAKIGGVVLRNPLVIPRRPSGTFNREVLSENFRKKSFCAVQHDWR